MIYIPAFSVHICDLFGDLVGPYLNLSPGNKHAPKMVAKRKFERNMLLGFVKYSSFFKGGTHFHNEEKVRLLSKVGSIFSCAHPPFLDPPTLKVGPID